jgi:hypothetical protein
MALNINAVPYFIDREECIGDSLGKLNANADYFDTRINSLTSFVYPKLTYIQTESVIGSTETTQGFFDRTTRAQGTRFFPAVERLADFRWEKADNTVVLVRMETVTPATYTPWQNFFPYKPFPTSKLVSTKMTVRQPVMDTSTSKDQMNYIFHVDWVNNKALVTGAYDEYQAHHQNQFVFIKKWDFTQGQEISILMDSNTTSPNFNRLGERNQTHSTAGNPPSPLKAQITPVEGIQKLPVWNYTGYSETSNISIFIENTFRHF